MQASTSYLSDMDLHVLSGSLSLCNTMNRRCSFTETPSGGERYQRASGREQV